MRGSGNRGRWRRACARSRTGNRACSSMTSSRRWPSWADRVRSAGPTRWSSRCCRHTCATMYDFKVEGLEALQKKLETFGQQVEGLHKEVPEELLEWQRVDMRRQFPNMTI